MLALQFQVTACFMSWHSKELRVTQSVPLGMQAEADRRTVLASGGIGELPGGVQHFCS